MNLNGYEKKVLDDFVLEDINKDKITPLTKIFFELLRPEQQWIFEPRLYIKGDKAYVHFIKKNGLKSRKRRSTEFRTIEGPHNPPYGEETIRFRIKDGGEVEQIGFKHRNISKEELSNVRAR